MDSIRTLPPEEFPHLLRHMPAPPKKLFLRGTVPSSEYIFLTIVGSRKYSSYGKEVCEMLIRELKGLPVVIVSGLALGIDSIAHRAALKNGLLTVAVPGSGLDEKTLYPASHIKLAKEILAAGGALISPFEEKKRAQSWMFPVRNRIMAGMSHATLVIEAEIKSGTLITSKHATEFNRDVLAVPGSIFSKQSEGPHMLMRLGATPITCGDDLREALGFKINEKPQAKEYPNLSADEIKILEILKIPQTKENLLAKAVESGIDVGCASSMASSLELKGLIEEKLGEMRLV